MSQLDIFAPPSVIDAAFWKFHRENPKVYEKIINLAERAKAQGRSKIGMKMIFEVIRWEHLIETNAEDFKLNNNYTSRYVRILERDRPELAKMFEQRRIRS